MDDLFANIIGGIIQIVPLIAVPFILKGIIDGVPVLGSALQKGFSKSSNVADKGLKASGLGARRRAQVMNGERNMFGKLNTRVGKDGKRRSTTLENFGNRRTAINNAVKGIEAEREARFGQDTLAASASGKAGRPYSASSNAQIARRAHDQETRAKAMEGTTAAGFDEHNKKAIDDPNSALGQLDLQRRGYASSAGVSAASTEARWKEATTAAKLDENGNVSAGTLELNTALGKAGLSRDKLVLDAHKTTGSTQAGNYADMKRQTDYAEIIGRTADDGGGSAEDQTLLQIAGGSVDVSGGAKRAQAVAVETSRGLAAKNTSAARSLAQSRMDKRQLQLIQSKDKNEYGEPLDAPLAQGGKVIQAPNTILEEMLRSNDVHEVLAARDEFMSQGQSGVISGLRAIENIENEGGFSGRQEILTQLKRTQLSEHGKATKENATFAVAWANSANSMTVAKQNQGRYTSQTDGQLAGQATSSLLNGISNGAVNAQTAERILTDDKLRNQFDQEQVQILQRLKDHGSDAVTATWNPDSGKLWAEEKATSTTPAPTYAAWKQKTDKAKGVTSASAPDPVDVPDSPQPTDDIQSVLPGEAKVPVPGSPAPQLKQYADKAGGVARMSRDKFIAFQKSLQEVPPQDLKDDNDDLRTLIAQIDAEVTRRNAEADEINIKGAENIKQGGLVSGPINKIAKNYEPLNMPPLQAASEDDDSTPPTPTPTTPTPRSAPNSSATGYAQDVSSQALREEMRIAKVEFGDSPLESLGIDNTRSLDAYDQSTRDQMFATLRSYRQSLRNTQGTGTTGAPTPEALRDALRRDMERVANNDNLGNN